jgi:hypothetical protein
LILQVSWKLVGEHFFHVKVIPAYDLVMTPVSCLWWVAGPVLLLVGFVRARGGQQPFGAVTVQISHAVLWALSSFISLEFAMAI